MGENWQVFGVLIHKTMRKSKKSELQIENMVMGMRMREEERLRREI